MATEASTSAGEETPRKRSKSWTESEEIALITLVLEKEELLFGELKGAWGKSIHRKRSEAWDQIGAELNTRYIDNKREGGEVKKKFFNLKQRAKSKIDALKASRYKTGGGPAPPALNAADEALTQSLEGRPGIHGLENSLDTDEIIQDQDGNNRPDHCEARTNDQCSTEVKEVDLPSTKDTTKKTFSKKRNQPEATYLNTILDTERIRLEHKKLELEIELLEKKKARFDSDIQLNSVKTVYYQLKLNAEFGLNVEISKNEQ